MTARVTAANMQIEIHSDRLLPQNSLASSELFGGSCFSISTKPNQHNRRWQSLS